MGDGSMELEKGMKTVVSLFDLTGKIVMPWLEAGYECYIVDIQHPKGFTRDPFNPLLVRVGADLLKGVPKKLPRDPAFVAAFPPCDHLSVSGARWFKGKGLRALADSVNMFATAAEYCEDSGAPYFIENPVSTISTYWRKPDFTFHPCHYSGYCADDNYTKKTCLWVGNGFRMPRMDMDDDLEIDTKWIHHQPPSVDRKDIRSATPMGFARAVFKYNKEPV